MRATILAAIVLAFSVSHASAVSFAVKMACADDYFAHCSMHAPDSPGVRACMRSVGRNLSQRCISALRDAGEIKQTRVASAKIHSPRNTVAAERSAVKKIYASKPLKAKAYASKSDTKKRYVEKRNAKKYASKEAARKRAADNSGRRDAGRKYARIEREYRVAGN